MISVGVKELKGKLSRYIAQAKEGQEIVITEHGKDVALIIPLSKERRAVKSLMEEGRAKWSGGKPKGTFRGFPWNPKLMTPSPAPPLGSGKSTP
ncbi:MAG: type II toxin-antitoxin system prevent-host-death family antitoxin [Deltaproteobacteria bacterium]|nr:type II toxin-antitoxin system prevent-host-death family antitoxin [Deltaproteobacteria bacterium]